MPLTAESLIELKQFFDKNLDKTLSSLRSNDSDRLVKNKINGFLISLQDRLFDLKPKLMCNGCGRAVSNRDHLPLLSQTNPIAAPGNNKDYDGF